MDNISPTNLRDTLTPREHEILRLVALGLSNRDIAEELVVAPETVRWYTKQIYSKLGISGRVPALVRAKELGLLQDETGDQIMPALPPVARQKDNLPALVTPFVGRSREIEEVRRLLQTTRLLTLTGVGGTGKTRLALSVASAVKEEFADGVCYVNLCSVSDTATVAKAIADALGVIENPHIPLLDALKRALVEKGVLFLLDNFEHVIEAAPLVAELLAAAPRLKALVTSREALHLSGEQEYPVPPLSLPSTDSPDALADSEAVLLFVQRVQMIQPYFQVTGDNAPAIGQICTRLDGLPLAIELAAGRCKLLTPQALLSRLDSRLNVLTGGSRDALPRQRSLRATIEWSYNLLDEGEKMLFARLSVFDSGRSLEAIEAICAEGLPIEVFDGLASLLDKNLIAQRETAWGEPRFFMLETILEYAQERLEASGEANAIRRRHAEYFVALAERAEPELHRADQLFWLDRLDAEHDNLRAALEWSLTNDEADMTLRLVGAMGWFWHMRSHALEGYRWALRALELRAKVAPAVRAKTLHITGNRLLVDLGDYTAMRKFQEEALQIARENDDRYNLAWALLGLGLAALTVRDYQEAERRSEEALLLLRDLDDTTGIGWALCGLGEAHRLRGSPQEAEPFYQEGLELFEAVGNRRGASMMLSNLAFAAYHQHHLQRARALFQKSYALQLLVGRQEEYAYTLTGMAGISAAQDEPERAVRLLAAADILLQATGATLVTPEKVDYQRILGNVRQQLDEATFEAAWVAGRKMTLEHAMTEALEEPS